MSKLFKNKNCFNWLQTSNYNSQTNGPFSESKYESYCNSNGLFTCPISKHYFAIS